tara:strand:+ start:11845 stop:12708 length:864 start_codon:yes stop_codon:yes gene_type:complete
MGWYSKVLVTGLDGFTGKHLQKELCKVNYDVVGLKSDLLDKRGILKELNIHNPDFIIHLAAISYTAESDINKIYDVNVLGTINLLNSIKSSNNHPKKIILASSGAVYGETGSEVKSEEMIPLPISHYACSKLCMENISKIYDKDFQIIITRPFNYTGCGHGKNFLIPKIVQAYKENKDFVELGNLDISREFNDVRDICRIYRLLLETDDFTGTINICSGNSITLSEIINKMNDISKREIRVEVNQLYVRKNEINDLYGNPDKLREVISFESKFTIDDTLKWMFNERD